MNLDILSFFTHELLDHAKTFHELLYFFNQLHGLFILTQFPQILVNGVP